MRLHLLEAFEEGSCVLANRIRLERHYLPVTTQGMDHHASEYLTRVSDVTLEQLRGSMCLIHSEEMCSNVYIEMALTLAMNGFLVHMIDLECYGYSAGHRINDICVEKFHHSITMLLSQASPDLPCYLIGHGVGALAASTFLAQNKHISEKIAGVVYLAPMFGQKNEPNFLKKGITSLLAGLLDELVHRNSTQLSDLTRNKHWVRTALQQNKVLPFRTAMLDDSIGRSIEHAMTFSHKVEYAHLTLIAEKDKVVDN